MSDASDKLFEKALDREINGIPPAEELGLVVISERAQAHHDKVMAGLHAENVRWQGEQDEMYSKNISDKSQRWADAKEIHDLAVSGYKSRLANLAKIGAKR